MILPSIFTAGTICTPLFRRTHCACDAIAASMISALDGSAFLVIVSSTCVATRNGTCAARHIAMRVASRPASCSQPCSTARSPRAIMMPLRRERMVARNIAGSCFTASRVSILMTMPGFLPAKRATSSCSACTSASLLTNERLTRSACLAAKRRSFLSFAVNAAAGNFVRGRLIPLSARNEVLSPAVLIMRT